MLSDVDLGQVGEANDLLPDIAAKAAKLKVLDAV